jgi:hypothetical protein
MRRYHVVTLFPSLLLLKENLKLKSKTISVAKIFPPSQCHTQGFGDGGALLGCWQQ